MTDEFDQLLDEETPPEPLPAGEPPTLLRASQLLDPDDDQDEGDFEPGGLYKGFEIIPPREWPHVPAHAVLQRRFYVRFNDTMGLVPWPGSKIVWPWENAWEQDLHREEVETFLKPEDEKKQKRK